jgi:tetratricopeptide (TPR) repeat protein
MNLRYFSPQRIAAALCIVLSACAAANRSGAADPPTGVAYGAFLAAEYADSQRDPASAAQYYVTALRSDPENPLLINGGFIAALLAGSPIADDLARQLPGNALATMLLANQAAQRGNYKAAEALFSGLPNDELSGLLKPLLVAWMVAGGGDTNAALNILLPAAQNSPFGEVYVLNAALIADNANDMKDAVQLYAAADAAVRTPNLRLAQILASWKARQGQVQAARQALAQMAAAHPSLGPALPALYANIDKPVIGSPADGLAEAYLAVAGALDQPKQMLLRMTFLRFALSLRPDLSAARLLLADVQSGGEQPPDVPVRPIQFRQAYETLQPIPEADPLYEPAALQEAMLLAALGEPDQGVALLDKLIAMQPDNIEALQTAGDILRGEGKFGQSVNYYGRAIALLPQPPPASAWVLYYDRGLGMDQGGGSWPAAEVDLRTALSLSPNQPYVLNYLAYSWALRGEHLNEARAMLEQAVSLDPSEGAIIDSLGFVNLRQGHTEAALKLLVKAAELDPDDAEVNAHLGDAFWASGMRLQAAFQWQRALGLQPDAKLHAELEDKLKQLQPPA